MSGEAVITSSSASEVSQESDQIGGSFFSHHLISGLRGAADISRDGKVTLGEAYQFAFNETLAGTEKTVAGTQHPAYEMAVSGTGEVVLTDLRGTAAVLTLPPEAEGRFYIRDRDDRLVVELAKHRGAQVDIGLETGTYSVAVVSAHRWSGADVSVKSATQTTLDVSLLKPIPTALYVSRGAELEAAAQLAPNLDRWRTQFDVGVALSSSTWLTPLAASYFLSPLINDPSEALDVLRFVQHPSFISLTIEPAFTTGTPLATALSASFYPWSSTGVQLSAGLTFPLTTGNSAYINTNYSIGADHYFSPNFRMALAYAGSRAVAGSVAQRVSPDRSDVFIGGASFMNSVSASDGASLTASWLVTEHWLLEAHAKVTFSTGSFQFGPETRTSSTLSRAGSLGVTRFLSRRFSVGMTVQELGYRTTTAAGLMMADALALSPRLEWYPDEWWRVGASYTLQAFVYVRNPTDPLPAANHSVTVSTSFRF